MYPSAACGTAGLRAPRPQTHKLLASVIEELGGKLEAITITDLDDHTFFATLSVRLPDGEVRALVAMPGVVAAATSAPQW